MKNTSIILLMFVLVDLVFLNGCGRGSLAKVEGIVRCDCNPVPNAIVYFQPEKGRYAKGMTQKDGSFVLSTYQDADGALIGRHAIRVGPTDWTLPNCPARLSSEKDIDEVEVVKGENRFDIDVPKRNPREFLMIPGD